MRLLNIAAAFAGFLTIAVCARPCAGHSGPPFDRTLAPIRFEVKFSKPLAVYKYVSSLSPKARSNNFKIQFMASRFAAEPYLALLSAFDSIPTDYEYKFSGFTDAKIEGSTWYLLKRNMVLSTSLDDFRTRSLGVIPMSDLNRMVAIIDAFTPVYDALIYEPSRTGFERQLHEIEAFLKGNKVETLFERIRSFYHASWDPSIPFLWVFYPRPGAGGFMATAYANVAESELPTDMKDYTGIITVMLHEASHILLDEQSREVGWQMQGWYESNPARAAPYAQGLMQESWATAVANGFFRKELAGAIPTGRWYNQKHIDEMAKQLLPLVSPYLATGKPIDKPLIDSYIDLFEHRFSAWLSDWEFLMVGRAVISERPEDLALIDRKFPYRNAQKYLKDFSPESLRELRDSRINKVIIVTQNNASILKEIQQHFPELRNWSPQPEVDFTHSVVTDDRKRLIVVNLVTGNLEAQLNKPLPPIP